MTSDMTTGDTVEGGCMCGALRYRVTGPIEGVAHCHCTMCRRWSGAVAVTWFTVPLSRFDLHKGEFATYESSEHGRRHYCPKCATQLAFWSSRRAEEIDITLGTIDHPEAHPASYHVYTSSRLPWLRLDDHLPTYKSQSSGSAS